jgi:hypothetical protein
MSKNEPVYIIKIYPAPVEIEVPAQALAEAVAANKDSGLNEVGALLDYYKGTLSDYNLEVMDFTYQVREVRTNRIVDAGDDKDFASGIHPN